MTKIFDTQNNSQKTSISRHPTFPIPIGVWEGDPQWPTGMHCIPSVGDIHDSGMHWMSTPGLMNEPTCHDIQQIPSVT